MFDIASVDMSTAPIGYGYDADGIYCGTESFSLDPLESEKAGMPVWLQPGNTLTTPPGEMRDGHVWKRVDDAWQELEDHRGESGFVNGEPFTIKELGPLPEGWSTKPSEPTEREKILAQILELESQQTPRRLREAALTGEGRVWLQNLDAQIAAKRAELSGL